MKKTLTIFSLISFSALFAQITITSNIPTSVASGAVINAEVKINKGGIGNFAKYQMDAPSGYVVSPVEVKGGNFTFENQRAKIVWVSIPSEAEIILKFTIQVTSSALSSGTISQKFYYLENNEKKEVEGAPLLINVNGGSNAVSVVTPTETKTVEPIETKVVETPVTETKPVETKIAETIVTETKPVETKVVETIVTETKPVETKVIETVVPEKKPAETKEVNAVSKNSTKVNSSTSEAGLVFRVQLGAYLNQPDKSKFTGIKEIKVDFINGLHKVTAGNFSTFEEALKYRDQLQSKGFNGFVAKYKDGKRVKI